jgi:hypothetical protein
MRTRIVRSIAVIAGLTLFPVVGTAANLSINTDWADKAVIAGKPAYLAIGAVPDRAAIEVTAEGSLGSIQDNDGVFSIETITGTGNLLTVTATAELDGETVDEIYTINVVQPVEPEVNASAPVVGTCDFADASGVQVGIITFTYDPRTVDAIDLHEDGGPPTDAVVSTTRKITSMDGDLDISGESVAFASFFAEQSIGTWYGAVDSSVLDASKPGSICEVGRGTQGKSEPGSWNCNHFREADASMIFATATNDAASGSWDYAEFDNGSGTGLTGKGTFICGLQNGSNGKDQEPQAPVDNDITVYGDKEMLEGAEGHIQAYSESAGVNPVFEYVSGAPVQISTDPAEPFIAVVIPDEVSANSESTIRIIVGNKTVNHAFTVINEAEPEQAHAKTLAQCTFYHDLNGSTGVAGRGTFAFDKRTVHNFFVGTAELRYPPIQQVISTTRAIDEISLATGLIAFDENGNARTTSGLGNIEGGGIWYSGSGHSAGQLHSPRRGAGFYVEHWRWTTRDLEQYPYGEEHTDIWFNGEDSYANDSAAKGRWAVEFPNPPAAQSGGYFECVLADEGVEPDSSDSGPSGDSSEPSTDSEPSGDGSEPSTDSEPSGNGSEPTTDSESSGDGSEPTTEPEPSGDGSGPTTDSEPSGDGAGPTTDSEPSGDGSEPTAEPEASEGETSVQSDQGTPSSSGGALGYFFILLFALMQIVRGLLQMNTGLRREW